MASRVPFGRSLPAHPTRTARLAPSALAGSSLASEPGVPLRSCSEELQRASSDSHAFSARLSAEGGNGGATGAQGGGQPTAARASTQQRLSAETYSPAGSARSSFALERASVEANRASLEAFQEAFSTGPLMPPAKPPPQPSTPTTPSATGPAISFEHLCHAAQLPPSLREK